MDQLRTQWIRVDGLDTLMYRTMDSVMREHSSMVSVIVVQNDTIKFEHYYKGLDTSSVTTIFSVSKSLTSMLCGVAVREGYIKSVHDPVTDYIPELRDADPMFSKLTDGLHPGAEGCRSYVQQTDCGASAEHACRSDIQGDIRTEPVYCDGPSVLWGQSGEADTQS